MLITESQRLELLARVLRKEQLAKQCEQGKISPEEYVHSINVIRAAEALPPLLPHEAKHLPRRPYRSKHRSS